MDLAAQFVWEDVVEQVPLPGQGPGLEGLKDILRGMRAAFPDLNFSIEEQISEDDKVASRFEWTGTHHGEFLGVPATGRQVRVWGIVIDRFKEGRIKETRIHHGHTRIDGAAWSASLARCMIRHYFVNGS